MNNLGAFLWAFFPDDDEQMYFRALPPKNGGKGYPKNLTLTNADLANYAWLELSKLNETRGIYFIPNAGGHTNKEIVRLNAVFIERDDISISEQHEALNNSPIPPSIRVETKKSVHAYWLLKGWCNQLEWREIQLGLMHHFSSDPSIKNPARCMRLPFFNHISMDKDGSTILKPVELVAFHPGQRYYTRQLLEAFPMPLPEGVRESGTSGTEITVMHGGEIGEIIGDGRRNTVLFSLAGSLRRRGLGYVEIMSLTKIVNETRVRPMLTEDELESIVQSVLRY